MPSRKELKQIALAKLDKNWNSTLKVNAILAALAIFIEIPLKIFSNNRLLEQGVISTEIFLAASVGYLIYMFLSIPIFYGIKSFYMNISRGLGGRVADIFEGYKQFFSISSVILVSTFFIMLWLFWLLPYMETTYAEFYDRLKEIKYGSNAHVEQIKEIEKEMGEELQQ